jgi:phage FluMu protein Com
VRAFDLIGNENSSLYFFTIDSTKPTIILNTPENNTLIPGGTVLEFNIMDSNLAEVNYSVNGGQGIPITPPYFISTIGWLEENYTILVNAYDFAGNSNSSLYFFTVDSTLPLLWFDPAINHSTVRLGTIIQLNVSDIHLENVLFSLDGGDYSVLSDPYTLNTIGWTDGTHRVRLRLIDAAKNEVNRWFDVTIDAVFPYVASTTITDQQTETGVDNTIIIIFNEPMDQMNTKDHVTFSPSQDFTCQWNRDGTILSIYFSVPNSAKETTFEVTIDDGIKDLSGNNMLSNFEMLFKIEVPIEPTVSSATVSEPVFPYWIVVLVVIIFFIIFWLFYRSEIWPLREAPEKEPSMMKIRSGGYEPITPVSGPVKIYKRLRCPECQKGFKVESTNRLLYIKCPNCRTRGRIDRPTMLVPKATKSSSMKKRPTTAPKAPKPSSLESKPRAAPKAPKPSYLGKEPVGLMRRVRCPNCTELFMVKSGEGSTNIKCTNCGLVGSLPH